MKKIIHSLSEKGIFLVLKMFYCDMHNYFKLVNFRCKWKKKNADNLTSPKNIFDISKVSIGKGTYGNLNVIMYGSDEEYLKIGNYCSISGNVYLVLGGEHSYKRLSQYPFSKLIYHKMVDAKTKGPIIIEDDVWIGYGAIILSGITLGKGCIVGAGSVVAKDIPPYAIFAGGKIVKYRFSENIRGKLKKIDMGKWTDEVLESYGEDCMTEICAGNVDEFCRRYI